MKTSLQRIYGSDGLEHCGLLHEPDRKTRRVVAHVHGMGENFYENHFLDYLAQTLTKQGIAFFPVNNSGAGHQQWLRQGKGEKFVKRGDTFEKFTDCVTDIKAQIDFLYKQGYRRIFLQGHSLGAPKVVYYQARTQDPRITGLVLLAPADMHGLTRLDKKNDKRDLAAARRLVKQGRGQELLKHPLDGWYPISARTYLSLGVAPESGVLSFSNPQYKFKHLNSIAVPILTAVGKKDSAPVVTPAQLAEIIKKNTKQSPRVQTVVLGNAPHSFFKYESKLAATVARWIKSIR
jgi:pimeloyl-ACP methyl ester carboxylesterase